MMPHDKAKPEFLPMDPWKSKMPSLKKKKEKEEVAPHATASLVLTLPNLPPTAALRGDGLGKLSQAKQLGRGRAATSGRAGRGPQGA